MIFNCSMFGCEFAKWGSTKKNPSVLYVNEWMNAFDLCLDPLARFIFVWMWCVKNQCLTAVFNVD